MWVSRLSRFVTDAQIHPSGSENGRIPRMVQNYSAAARSHSRRGQSCHLRLTVQGNLSLRLPASFLPHIVQVLNPIQNPSITSPPAMVASFSSTEGSMFSEINRTEPSAIPMLQPPG